MNNMNNYFLLVSMDVQYKIINCLFDKCKKMIKSCDIKKNKTVINKTQTHQIFKIKKRVHTFF